MSDIFVRKTDGADMSAKNEQCMSTEDAEELIAFDVLDNSGPHTVRGKDGYVCPEDIFLGFAQEIRAYKGQQFNALMWTHVNEASDVDDVSSAIYVSRRLISNYGYLRDRILHYFEVLPNRVGSAYLKQSLFSGDQFFNASAIVAKGAKRAFHDIMAWEAEELDYLFEMLEIRYHDPDCFHELMEEFVEENEVDAHLVRILESSKKYFRRAGASETTKSLRDVHVTNKPLIFK